MTSNANNVAAASTDSLISEASQALLVEDHALDSTQAIITEHLGDTLVPPKKRQKLSKLSADTAYGQSSKASGAGRRRRSKMELVSTLNMDVLCHIMSFLSPMDLLNLARTTQGFRRFLMHKSSNFVWKTARLNVEGFPECPPDLSEPQYANLAFYPHCHICDKVGHMVMWKFRVRYCSACKKSRMISALVLPDNIIGPYLLSLSRDSSYDAMIYHLEGTTESVPVDKFSSWEILTRVTQIIGRGRLATHAIDKHTKECEKWSESVREARRHELKNARTARKNGIRMWLIEQGWEPEMAYFDWDFIAQLSIIREPRWLTPRILDNLSSPLTEWMLKLRDIRIEKTVFSDRRRILIEAYKSYLNKQKQPGTETQLNDIMPHVADVSAFQPFDAIIRSLFDKVITAKHFRPAFAELPTLISAWRQRIEAELVECYLPPLSSSSVTGETAADAPSPATRLKLASSIFFSRDESTIIYPDMLADQRFVGLPKAPKFRDAAYEMHETLGGTPWSTDIQNERYQIKLFEPAADIIRTCGMDPDTATVDDMNVLDARLECRRLSPMTWHKAISRAIKRSCRGKRPLKFVLVNDLLKVSVST